MKGLAYYYNYSNKTLKTYRDNMSQSDMKTLKLVRIDDITAFRNMSDNEKNQYVSDKLGGGIVIEEVKKKPSVVEENKQMPESDEHIEVSELESLQKRFTEIFGNQKRVTEKQMNNEAWLKKQINSINI